MGALAAINGDTVCAGDAAGVVGFLQPMAPDAAWLQSVKAHDRSVTGLTASRHGVLSSGVDGVVKYHWPWPRTPQNTTPALRVVKVLDPVA